MDIIGKNSNQPLISVIIPAYNAERYISKTLDSVLHQTYRNIEVLVINDGSQDRTAEIIESICQHNHRVYPLYQPHLGVAAARNAGIRQSRGQLIAPVDADDIWHPQNLEKLVHCMLKGKPSLGLVYAWSVVIDEQGLLTGDFRASPIEGEVFETLLSHNFVGNASACLIRRNCFNEVGCYSTKFFQQSMQGCEDWDLYLRIAEHRQFRVVSEFLIGYRRTKKGMSHSHTVMAISHSLMIDGFRLKRSAISPVIYLLSFVNFYLYLAHDSRRTDHHETTRYWLVQAFRTNVIVTLLSYRLYSLIIKNFLRFMARALALPNRLQPHFKPTYSPKHWSIDRLAISVINKKRMILKFNLLLQKIYHRLIKTFFVKSAGKS